MKILIPLFLLISLSLQGQTDVQRIQKEIDTTLWRAFQKAFEKIDGEALNDTYANQVLRVTPSGIDTEGIFKKQNLKRFAQNKKRGDQIKLDFWLDDRKTNAFNSYEVGYYKITFIKSDGAITHNYGQFHILLEKIQGHWKIKQDWDTTIVNGRVITAEDFERKEAKRFYTRDMH